MIKIVKHLVITVSAESSAELLHAHADILVLDEALVELKNTYYDTVYIRSHFSQPSTMPQHFRSDIDNLVQRVKRINPKVRFIDGMDNVDIIVAFEDKWHQYIVFGKFMPRTELYDDNTDISSFLHPIYKKRLSSRGSGVTWDKEKVIDSTDNWIIQESLNIQEELRVYVIFGEVYPVGAVKQSMTEGRKARGVSSRPLAEDEITFSKSLMEQAPGLDIVGVDIARASDGRLSLMEVNRSPGFAKFYELTGFNLAEKLYEN